MVKDEELNLLNEAMGIGPRAVVECLNHMVKNRDLPEFQLPYECSFSAFYFVMRGLGLTLEFRPKHNGA